MDVDERGIFLLSARRGCSQLYVGEREPFLENEYPCPIRTPCACWSGARLYQSRRNVYTPHTQQNAEEVTPVMERSFSSAAPPELMIPLSTKRQSLGQRINIEGVSGTTHQGGTSRESRAEISGVG